MRIINKALLMAVMITALHCGREDLSNYDAMTINPANEETNVKRDASIKVSFDRSVDTGLVKDNFHLVPYQRMEMIMDSVMRSSFLMDSCQSDSMMKRMMNDASIPGQYQWNSVYTEYFYDPDSLLSANTLYAVHLGRSLMEAIYMPHNESIHDMEENMGIMDGAMIIQFTVGEEISNNGDHESHH